MSRLSRRIRSRRDYVGFQVAREWPIALSVAGVVLGAATILPNFITIVLSVIAFVLGLVALAHDVQQLRRRWCRYEFSAIAAPFPAAAIPPPAAYPDPVYLYLPNRGTALVSHAIDRTVSDRSLVAELSEERYRLPAILKASAPYVLPVCNHGHLVFNGEVVGMRGDPLPAGTSTPPITLHLARFFDSQCSNEMCALRITNRDTGEEFDPRRKLLVNTDGRLRTLAESQLANVIGISTVALTSDGELVLIIQSSRNVASPLLLAPSGSGSLDSRDVVTGQQESLVDIVRRGMERELCEETGIQPTEITSTTVVGFARWLERGAKPEFFGMTELLLSAADLTHRRHLASDEQLYSGGLLTVPVNLSALGQEIGRGGDLLSAPSLPDRIRDEGSLPLLLALRAAALRQRRSPNRRARARDSRAGTQPGARSGTRPGAHRS